MKIYLRYELPFVTVRLEHEEEKFTLPDEDHHDWF
jgi:hypothetical protein